MSDSLSAEVVRLLAEHHLANLKAYGAKAREAQDAGREDLAAVFRTLAIHSGRQWLSLTGSSMIIGLPGEGKRAHALRTLEAARAAGRPVVTNLEE